MSGKITKEKKQPDLSFESSDEANSSDRVCVGDLQELDESFEGFDEKSLKQLLEEREKLLSMLNNNSDDKQADDDEVETEEKSDGESVESSPTTSITTNSSVVAKQQEKLSEDISGEIAVPSNQNKRRHSADCLPIDNSVADLIEDCKTPIDAESSDEFRTPKKFRAIDQDDDEQQQQQPHDAADNSFYFKTPGFDDSTPDDTAENFLLVDDIVVSEEQHRQQSTPTAINTFDDLWDFSTVATGSGSDGVDIYDFDREFSNWTRDGCRKAGEFLTRYCRLAPDGPGIEPVYKRTHSLKGGQKCTVYIDRIQYRASGWKSSEEAARDEAALLTLRDILPASCQSVIDDVLKDDEAEPTNEISLPDDRNSRNVSLDRRYGKTVEEFEEYSEDGEYDEEFDEEIYKLLDEELENGLISSKNGVNRAAENNSRFEGLRAPPNVKDKYVLKYRGTEYFEVLPDGWIEVTHSSGVSVYLHKASRVCTLARPYFLGPGSVRNHNVPLACVPCYHQRKIKELHQQAAEKEKLESEKSAGNSNDPLASLDKLKMPQVKLQTVDDFKNRNLTSKQLNDYCQNLFDFEKIQVIRFKSWADHRIFHRKVKREQQQQQHEQKLQTTATLSAGGAKRGGGRNGLLRNSASGGVCPISGDGAVNVERLGRPSLPSSVKLITVPDLEKGTKPQQKQFYLNPQGKTSISVLHEYVQKVLKGQVLYDYSETRNAANPYMATVKISSGDAQGSIGGTSASGANAAVDWVAAGNGVGNSKKNAKSDAARDALRILVPGIEFNEEGVAGGSGVNQDDVTDLFDLIAITDSRVHELSVKAGQPTPFVILQECLKRHAAFGDTTIGMEIRRVRHQKHEFQMQVGKHKVVVSCANKKEGKQKAAQFMLQKLQPQIKTWGSLIRLYGYGAQRKLQETRKEKDSIIKLQGQSKSQPTEPNTAILDKLRQEMKKLFDESSKATSSSVAAKSISNNPSNSIKSIDI